VGFLVISNGPVPTPTIEHRALNQCDMPLPPPRDENMMKKSKRLTTTLRTSGQELKKNKKN
jgi:hypothetical protein